MSQNKPALVTDMAELIRGATEKPAPVVIGEKTEVVEERAAPGKPRAKTAKAPGKTGAKKGQGKAPPAEVYPWADANPKITKFVQVRMPEPLHIKLAWIKANSIGAASVHDLILGAITEMADQRIERIKKGDRGG